MASAGPISWKHDTSSVHDSMQAAMRGVHAGVHAGGSLCCTEGSIAKTSSAVC